MDCALCRGAKLLCNRSYCPVLASTLKKVEIDSSGIDGSSPPGLFIGRFNYPKVSVGPLVPDMYGDTSILDTPEYWIGRPIHDIVKFRTELIRGTHELDVRRSDKVGEYIRELAMADRPVEVEFGFAGRPFYPFIQSPEVPPFGPSVKFEGFKIGNVRSNWRVERETNDFDELAVQAILRLYNDGILISSIQKAFSAGLFGLKRKRKFVPTRWSITAVDDLIGKKLVNKLKEYPTIDEYRIFYSNELENRWFILLLPDSWKYELIEAWFPGTTWNLYGNRTAIYSSHEKYDGRKKYAEIGGCYYSARLAIGEYLNRERRQAGAIIFREAHPGYVMPLGVWVVREYVRETLKRRCEKFDTMEDALNFISKGLDIPMKSWIWASELIKELRYQRRLEDYS